MTRSLARHNHDHHLAAVVATLPLHPHPEGQP